MKKKFLFGALVLALVFGLIGCDKDKEEDETPPPPCTVLTVKGIPAETKIVGASLVKQEDQTPVASALGNGGVFEFYEPAGANSFYPDSNKPWKGTGEYIIILAQLKNGVVVPDPTTGEGLIMYIYIGNGSTPTTYSFNNDATVTLPWSNFTPYTLTP